MIKYINKMSIQNSYIFIGSAYTAIILSLLLPIAMVNDNTTFYPSIEILTIAKRFINDNALIAMIIPIIIYPYTFAILYPIFLSRSIVKMTEKLLILTKKDDKYIKYPIYFIRGIVRILISYIPITVNIIVYIGFYLMPIKPFLMSALGIIIFGIMLFTNFYLIKQSKIQKERCSKTIYIAVNYTLQNILYIIMATTIMIWKEISILIGGYIAIIGFILLLIGNLIILRNKSEVINSY